jgi:hypothetical protein
MRYFFTAHICSIYTRKRKCIAETAVPTKYSPESGNRSTLQLALHKRGATDNDLVETRPKKLGRNLFNVSGNDSKAEILIIHFILIKKLNSIHLIS